MPVASPVNVVLAVLPVVVVLSAVLVNVQVPVAGKPLKIALPVARVHVGWVKVPTTGAVNVAGCALITIFAEGIEVQEALLVTL